MATFLASLKVDWSSAEPAWVGSETTPHLTLSWYAAMAHGPTLAMAAVPSANESPVYASLPARFCAYNCCHKPVTARPASLSKVDFLSVTSCFPPLAAAYIG